MNSAIEITADPATMPVAALASTSLAPASAASVLLVTTDRWYPTARLGIALANAGCFVYAVCPSKHPLRTTDVVRGFYPYKAVFPLASLLRAIQAVKPRVVIPGDDLAASQLHELYRWQRQAARGAEVCELIERSVGVATGFEVIEARAALMRLAREKGVRVPKTEVIDSLDDLTDCITRTGFPLVLKANGTSGGMGVRVVHTVEEATRALRKLKAPPLLARAVKRALCDQDFSLLRSSFLRRGSAVSAQEFVRGSEATSTIACWKGTLLASLHFEVLEKVGPTGHATVLKLIEHPEMSAAAETIARQLQLSGVHGLDFMLEANTRHAYLIELNPRSTQVGHLALGYEKDIPAALFAAVTGKDVRWAPKVTDRDTIALFPQEWKRNFASPFLTSAYHDIPWEKPSLVAECMSLIAKQRVATFRKAFWTQLRNKYPSLASTQASRSPRTVDSRA